jgi:hypothetical protein
MYIETAQHDLQCKASKQRHPTPAYKAGHARKAVSTQWHHGSQAHRRVDILGPQAPFFGNFKRVFDRLIEILAQHEGVFRPVLPENLGKPLEWVDRSTPSRLANAHRPAGRNPWRELASPEWHPL